MGEDDSLTWDTSPSLSDFSICGVYVTIKNSEVSLCVRFAYKFRISKSPARGKVSDIDRVVGWTSLWTFRQTRDKD